MTGISTNELKIKLMNKKSQLEENLVEPKLHISKCDIHDVVDAAEALTTREKEYRLYQHKLLQLQKIESVITKLKDGIDIECASCGISILERLDVIPTAQYCVNCQEKIEMQTK